LEWLCAKGLGIGDEIDISRSDSAAGLLELACGGGRRIQLGTEAAERVFVAASASHRERCEGKR